MHVSICFKPSYRFSSHFDPFMLVELYQRRGLPYLMTVFAGSASLYSGSMLQISYILFGNINSYFRKNKVIFSSFLSHKNRPNNNNKIAPFCMHFYLINFLCTNDVINATAKVVNKPFKLSIKACRPNFHNCLKICF